MEQDLFRGVLCKGSVQLIDFLGDDLTVVNAARVSFRKARSEFKPGYELGDDNRLLRSLARDRHWTPYAQAQLQFRVKMPIFVARQFMKSNVGVVYNETSRRYVKDECEFYEPQEYRGKPTGGAKQGSAGTVDLRGIEGLTPGSRLSYDLASHYDDGITLYNKMIEAGVAPEMARIHLPVGLYTEFVMTASLAAVWRIVGLRDESHAQYEIQLYGKALNDLTEKIFPECWKELRGIASASQPQTKG